MVSVRHEGGNNMTKELINDDGRWLDYGYYKILVLPSKKYKDKSVLLVAEINRKKEEIAK